MKRRNVEGKHDFAKAVAERLNIFELGGLLLDENWEFTAAVEAFELSHEEAKHRLSSLIEADGFTKDLYMVGVFAERLGIPFYIVAHVWGGSRIHVYEMRSDEKTAKLQCDKESVLTEEEFIDWWRNNKGTPQKKVYREDFIARAEASYFDNLLERHGLKWGGNIDGCLAVDSGAALDIAAVIENRFTNRKPLSEYDPNNYYHGYNGGDFHTWLPLMKLKDKLGIPLFLMTYSNREGEENLVGITQVLGQSKEEGLFYIQDTSGEPVCPGDNMFDDAGRLREWIFRMIELSRMPEVEE